MKVFVYGTLKSGHYNNGLLRTSKLLESGIKTIPFKMISLGAFPALVPDEELHEIVGEIYEVDEYTMENLDRLEGFPMFYSKTKIDECFIYYLPNKHDKYPEIKDGNWQ